ncbi:hypothetical protein TRP8649_02101 [Pelagimonas phthalicica]|uniref:Uncharacterized protein n=1 Tax=Pelagimonas phthalicica TaxID=1037362 RepID=A0A238JBL4_9RHOB|nr:hypothetical protein [Pelagimonas phthalicica]TDS90942.1 hypothetical protein CLV87_2103 [Pelagimonas phthalicica]SMX27989.1 hypothetical protein TRP8649_02101 [Pelagimonas phthalicica]
MSQLDPSAGRSTVTGNDSELNITITARRSWFTAAFLTFWMMGWVVGEAFALLMVFGSGSLGISLFMLIWLAAWTAGGLASGATLLWLLIGREIITIDHQTITVTRSIRLWKRRVDCETGMVKNLRLDSEPKRRYANKQSIQGILSSRHQGVLKFDYGVHTIGFGLDLDQAEARQILDLISERFPDLINQSRD